MTIVQLQRTDESFVKHDELKKMIVTSDFQRLILILILIELVKYTVTILVHFY